MEHTRDRSSAANQDDFPAQQDNFSTLGQGGIEDLERGERLRKAIERNRLKLQQKSEPTLPEFKSASGFSSYSGRETPVSRAPREATPAKLQTSLPRYSPRHLIEKVEDDETAPPASPKAKPKAAVIKAKNASSLIQAAFREDDVPFQKTKSKINGKIRQILDSPSLQDPLNNPFPFARSLIMGGWFFCLLMIFTLIFRQGGVMTYYSKQRLIDDRQFYLELLKKENLELTKSIRKIKTDRVFQKKMARDHLGLIAPDEYLILFSEK